jgi:2-dehydro-3-deoxyglucarate aldolase
MQIKKIQEVRNKLQSGNISVGSWMQIPHPAVAEIMGHAGYDWVAVDLEHGSISVQQLPDLFRALELGGTLPLARLAQAHPKDCKQALDAGAGGVIVPMVESAEMLEEMRKACCWPPAGTRGVGYSRANLFGKHFDEYVHVSQSPLIVAQIEHIRAVENLEDILSVNNLDAVLVGPYDLSASMGLTSRFDHEDYKAAIQKVLHLSEEKQIPAGIHVVQPNRDELQARIVDGFRFIAFSIDAVFLFKGAEL